MLKEQYISPEIEIILFEIETAVLSMSNEGLGYDDGVTDL